MRALLAVLIGALVWPAAAIAAESEATSTAIGVQVVTPDGERTSSAVALGPPGGEVAAGGFVFPAEATGVATGRLAVEATARLGREAGAFARAEVATVSLFGGDVRAESVVVQAGARAVPDEAGGTLDASSVTGLVVLGQPVSVGLNTRVELGDWGYLVALEQAVTTEEGELPAFRGFVVGLHVHVTKEHAGLQPGTEILIGYAEAAVRAGDEPPAAAEPPAPAPGEPSEPPAPPPEEPAEEELEPTTPEEADRDPQPPPATPTVDPRREGPPAVEPRLTGGGFVFPVYGPSSFSNDYAAPRATTGWHHGNDVYAPLGAPVLAVTAGELFLVGWNTIGGNRLWLRDDDGNEYYYAHLSAFTPQAVDGARVEAGDVVGFVGASGDAVGTPPHLHFEIHPKQLLSLGYDGVINPFTYLSAWQRVQDADFVVPGATTLAGTEQVEPVPPPGAALLGYADVSSVSGLNTGALEQLLTFADGRVEGSFSLLISPQRDDLLGAEPGFSPR